MASLEHTTRLETIINNLAEIALNLRDQGSNYRYIVGLVAVPAAGKTTLAKFLCKAINERCTELTQTEDSTTPAPQSNPLVALLPMDGFHLTRNTLTNRRSNLSQPDSQSGSIITSPTYITPQSQLLRDFPYELQHPFDNATQKSESSACDDQLYAIQNTNSVNPGDFQYRSWPGTTSAYAHRGAPYTFDPFLLSYALSCVKYNNPTIQIWPGWDHARKDPSYDELISIPSSAKVIIIEGLYLLLDVEPWKSLLCGTNFQHILSTPPNADSNVNPNLGPLIDVGIVLTCDEATTLERGSIRNFKAGITSTLEESIERWKANDIKNGQFLMAHLVHDKIEYQLSQDDVKDLIIDEL